MRKHVASVTVIAGLAFSAATVSTAQETPQPEGFTFLASLAGAQEPTPPDAPTTPSPGVQTTTTGNIQVIFAEDLSEFTFSLSVANGFWPS